MKTLSLTQPWATLVAIGAKKIETRSWQVHFRGQLAIHAAQGFPREARRLCGEPFFREVLGGAGYADAMQLPRGVIVAVANLAGCFRFTHSRTYRFSESGPLRGRSVEIGDQENAFGDFTPGRFGWLLDGAVGFKFPVAVKGARGLWEWEASLSDLEMNGFTCPRARAVIDRLQLAFEEIG
jgi:activating signal cointegrator 1